MWKYKGEEINSITQMPPLAVGFVYQVVHEPTGKKYIGKKILKTLKTLPPLKGTRRKRKIIKESDWSKYYGSAEIIKNLIKEGKQHEFSREILQYAFSKRELTYQEVKYQFVLGVLESEEYLNGNILSKFFKGNLK